MAKPKKKREPEKAKAAEQPEEIGLGTLIDWVNESDDATADSRDISERCRDYYDSKQWSEEEARALKKRKQAATVVNRIKPKMDGLAGMERANRTTAKAYPRTPKHEKDAQAATEAVRYVLQDNFYNQVRSAAWDNLTIEGTGGIEVDVKANGDRFDIYLNHIHWDRLIYDQHARRKDFSDARWKGQVVWLDYDIALERFPDGADILGAMLEGSSTRDDKPKWVDAKRRRVKVVELYYRHEGDVWYACFTQGGFLKGPRKSPYLTEDGETEDPYEFASLFVDREGNRYGATLQYLDVQDEINKRRSKALHLMSVRQVRWERGAVEDINNAREELAKPDGVVETTPGMEFEVLKTGDMAQAQFKLLEDAKLEIDAVGYSAAASGKEERLMSGVALRNREAASQTELAPMFDVLKHLDVRVYRKVWNRIKQYWRGEMWLRVTDDPTNTRWVALNRPVTQGEMALEQAKAAGAPPEALAALQAQIAMNPQMAERVTQNDIAALDVDIVMDDAPDSVTMQQEEFTALSEMVKSGIPIPPTAIIEASSLKNKEKILKEMQQGQVNPEAVKKMQEEFAAVKEENATLKADQQTEVAKLQFQAKAKEQEIAQGAQAQAAELALAREKQQAEIALAREKAVAEAQLAREKAAAEITVKKMTADADFEIASRKNAQDFEAQKQKQSFDQQIRTEDQQAKLQERAKAEEAPLLENAMPKFVEALAQITETFAKAMEGQQKAFMAVAEQLAKPKTVRLDGIERGPEGITGASATVQ